MIVLTRAKRAVLLSDEEEGCGLWELGWDNSSSFEVFINESLTYFLFLWVEGVYTLAMVGTNEGLRSIVWSYDR